MARMTLDAGNVLRNLEKMGINTVAKVVEQTQLTALDMENHSKESRPWTDRTGDARRSIYALADISYSGVRIYHGIRVDYGKYLELSNGGRYRVITPTVNKYRTIWLKNLSRTLTK
jgi:hypothetical protein